MCVLSSKLLFGGTEWIENWRRGDKHKLGFLPKKIKNIVHLQNLPLTAMCGGISCGDDYNLRIIHTLSAKYSFSLLRQISNGLAFLTMVKEHASFRRIPGRQKNVTNMTLQLRICFVDCFDFPIQMRWKVLSDDKFWKYIVCYLYFPVDWLVACSGKQRFCGTFWWKSSLCFLRHISTSSLSFPSMLQGVVFNCISQFQFKKEKLLSTNQTSSTIFLFR